jgi:hypothetical protein
MKRSLVSLNSFHLIQLALVLGLLFFTGSSPLISSVSTQQQNPNQPLTLQELNERLHQSAGHYMTEADLAVYIERFGITFDPTPDVISRLRANGAHQHLINTLKRAAEKLSASSGGKVVAIGTQTSDPVIEEARKVLRGYLDELPDFICQQVVERYYDLGGRGAWNRFDTLTYELTYNRGRESYTPINVVDRPATRPIEKLGGAYSTGDFASGIAALFDPETRTIFKLAGKERLDNRQTLVYDFRVPLESSNLEVKAEDEDAPTIIAAYSGTIWIDEETKRVLRMDQAVDDLPKSFPVTNSESSVNYGIVKLNGLDGDFLLPIRAEFIIANRRQKHYFRNLIYFKSYRKFETNIKILDNPTLPLKKQ